MTFDHLKTIYRDFDIRGKYPEEISPEEVYKIGKAIVHLFNTKRVAIGYDIRPSAEILYESLAKGITEMGAEVVHIGLCTTPMSYFVCGTTDVDATVMITASHMPSEYNGLKITIEDAKPVTGDFLKQIRDIVGTHTFSEEATHGNIVDHAFQQDWIDSFKQKHDLGDAHFTIVIDPANMIGVLEIDTFKAFEKNITVHSIFDTYDHTCPHHEANPIKHETLVDLGAEVRARHADVGIAFDGDADRVGFVDEFGTPVSSDLIGALLARYVLGEYPGGTVISDMRSTKALEVEVERLGGKVIREKVGHTHIRSRMRKEDAVLGIELAGHFFFKDTFFSEGGPLPVFMILELMKREGKTLSELVHEVRKFHHSGEINSKVTRVPEEIYTDLVRAFPEAKEDYTDGLTLTTPTWWCNVRPSANDPVMRLNVESSDTQTMEERRDEILAIIRR